METRFLEEIDSNSEELSIKRLNNVNRDANEQFFTPVSVGLYMSSMFKPIIKSTIYFLDPGAGVGNLTASFIASIYNWAKKPKVIIAILYEIDDTLLPELRRSMDYCVDFCKNMDVELRVVIKNEDFIKISAEALKENKEFTKYDYVILNPPYKKLGVSSLYKKLTLDINIDVSNYYAAFVALSLKFLKKKSQLISITPRSFCNGLHFKAFRKIILESAKIEKLHKFKFRNDIFNDVLQETLIMYLTNNKQKASDKVEIIESNNDDFSTLVKARKDFSDVVFPNDNENIIRIIKEEDTKIVDTMHKMPCRIEELGISVSTGPVVDFREKLGLLSFEGDLLSIPIIYPENFGDGFINWPIIGRKPGHLKEDPSNFNRLRPSGFYVLVKRFSSPEEKRRVVASVFDPFKVRSQYVAFDNKLNYFHIEKSGLGGLNIAKGLSLYLNSSLVDHYFRTFSGSTQVNVSDLKGLRYPTVDNMKMLGESYGNILPSQKQIDITVRDLVLK